MIFKVYKTVICLSSFVTWLSLSCHLDVTKISLRCHDLDISHVTLERERISLLEFSPCLTKTQTDDISPFDGMDS